MSGIHSYDCGMDEACLDPNGEVKAGRHAHHEDEWDRLVAFFDNLHGHWYTGDSMYGGEKERMMFSADVVRMIVHKFRARSRRAAG